MKPNRYFTLVFRSFFLVMVSLSAGIFPQALSAQPSGQELFANNCASCHKIDQPMAGPALGGIDKRRDGAWLLKWIRNSAAVIASGDQYAVDLFNQYNKTAMPAYDWSDEEIKSVLAYIKEEEIALANKPKAADGGDGTASLAGGGGPTRGESALMILALIVFGALLLFAGRLLSAQYRLRGIRLFNWNSINAGLFVVFLVVGMALVGLQFARLMRHTLPVAASEHGVVIDQMLVITFWITFVVFVITHYILFVYPWIYRRRGAESKALHYAHNDRLEFAWTIVPAIVLTVLILYGTKVWREITQSEPGKDALEIELFAYQFGWQARLPGSDGMLGRHDYRLIGATNSMGIDPESKEGKDDLLVPEVYLPVGEPVVLRLRARDVIHSAYLPHFRVQMNVVPGMPTQFVFTPTITTEEMREKINNYNFNYVLACNKICGVAHFNMQMKFVVVTRPEYDQWLARQRTYFKRPETQTASILLP
ncbi:MAG: c-type cytochrome [Sphingomonadales bacterium]|nr:c-type cytochrome [Sphingomonadales bacterium]